MGLDILEALLFEGIIYKHNFRIRDSTRAADRVVASFYENSSYLHSAGQHFHTCMKDL
jgi:hypothetical protein